MEIAKIENFMLNKNRTFEGIIYAYKKKMCMLGIAVFALSFLFNFMVTQVLVSAFMTSLTYLVFFILIMYIRVRYIINSKYKSMKTLENETSNIVFYEDKFVIEYKGKYEERFYHEFYNIQLTKKGYLFEVSKSMHFYFQRKEIIGDLAELDRILQKKEL